MNYLKEARAIVHELENKMQGDEWLAGVTLEWLSDALIAGALEKAATWQRREDWKIAMATHHEVGAAIAGMIKAQSPCKGCPDCKGVTWKGPGD